MRLLRLLSAAAAPAFALCMAAGPAHSQEPRRTPAADALMGPGVSRPLAARRASRISNVRYDLRLDVTRRDTAWGAVDITFTRRGTSDVILDFRGPAILSAVVNGRAVPDMENSGHHLRFPARYFNQTGGNQLELTFKALIAPAGASIIRVNDPAHGDYLYTLLVPSDAHALFPCFDQPDIKARLTLSLATPPGWAALSNGRWRRAEVATDSTSTHRFAETEPISTYLMAFAAGPWLQLGAPGSEIRLLARRSRAAEVEADTLIAMNQRALRWLGEYFGIAYPFQKYDMLLAPAFPFGGMEHPGAVFYNEETFIFREPPTQTQRLSRQATTFHEVAHQWFGDYTTMRWFDDLWLKEGFATYMAAKMQASLEPRADAWKTFYLRNSPTAYEVDVTAGTTPVWQLLANLDQAKSNYGPIVYNKAPTVLRQLEYVVGPAAFRRGVQRFLRQHAYGNATWRDLLAAIGAASGRSLDAWGAQYILRPGMPLIEQVVDVSGGRITRLRLVQRPAQPALSGAGPWPVKLELHLGYGGGEGVRIPVSISHDTTEVRAAVGRPAPDFVFANAESHAYALVLPDERSVAWLERHIGTVRDDFLRAMLWGSLFDLVRERRLDPARFAALVARELPAERDEPLASVLTGRLARTTESYLTPARRDALMPRVEDVLLAGASSPDRPYGIRKAQLDAYIALATTPPAVARLDAWLDSSTAAGLPLLPPTRWSIVTTLVARGSSTAEARLSAESLRDTSTQGKRRAFVAGAARPDSVTKRGYFRRYFEDRTLNEEWATSSLRALHDGRNPALTRALLLPALDSLPWIQRNRRIFFLGQWVSATIGGQSSPEALAEVDAFLRDRRQLPLDLRQKVLQARDDLERVVRIREAWQGELPPPPGGTAR